MFLILLAVVIFGYALKPLGLVLSTVNGGMEIRQGR